MRGSAPAVCLSLMLLVDGCSSTEREFSTAAVEGAVAIAPTVSGENLRAHVFAIVGERTRETSPPSPYNVEQFYGEPVGIVRVNSASYVTNAFSAAGLTPVLETSSDDGIEATNIYVDIPGERPELVLLTGHHDAWFQSGADDNASAVAILLEAARVLNRTTRKRSIRIIAFDREEEGLLGSERYQRAHAADDIYAVINMDCVGYARHEPGTQFAPTGLTLRDTGNFIAALANDAAKNDLARFVKLSNALPHPVDTLGLSAPGDGDFPGTGQFLRSDHGVFWKSGLRALFLTDTADFRNPNYHTKNDLPETLDYDFLSRVGELTISAIAAFAETD